MNWTKRRYSFYCLSFCGCGHVFLLQETKNDDGSEHGSDAESKGGTDGSTIIDAG